MILVLLAGAMMWGFWLEPAGLRTETVNVSLEWPYARPLRLAVVSDLHVGSPYHGISGLRRTVAHINASQPDLICILGDFVTRGVIGGAFVSAEAIAAELRYLRAPSGVVAVLGNHDRWYDGSRVQAALATAGIRVIEDTALRLMTPSGPIWVVGVSDLLTASHDVPRAISAVTDPATPILVITHNPDIFPHVPDHVKLTLAGHTHGGQVRLPFLGRPIVPSRYGQRYAAGLVLERGRHLFVSTGIGTTGIPVRFGVPPAIFALTLRQVER
jgi:predicted MPP superfamily phosphohydrolase